MGSILRSLLDLVVDVVRIIIRVFASPPPPPDYGDYDTDLWRWDPRRKRWVLRDSEEHRKGYNCTEYVVARIEGRAPRYGGDESETTETEEVEDRLHDLGWETAPERECPCGSGAGEIADCVVVYVCQGVVTHAAIYDKAHHDWGGKTSAGGPIARYQHPEDYFEDGVVPEGCEMRFYCPESPLSDPQKTDEWLHENARNLD